MSETNKSVLVIDTPKRCVDCPLFVRRDLEGDYECKIKDYDGLPIYYKEGNVDRPDWCPLTPLPLFKDISQYVQRGDAKSMTHMMMSIHAAGYNECLGEILKGKN